MDYGNDIKKRDGNIYRLKNFEDRVKKADKTMECVFTDFLNPEEQYSLVNISRQYDVVCNFFGGKGFSERKLASLISNFIFENNQFIEYPVDIVKISGNFKFEKLTHRDYLGVLFSLGIKREKIGDINVFEDGAEIPVLNDVSQIITQSINKIKHTGVCCSIIGIEDAREKEQQYKNLVLNAASMRVDAVISVLCNLSRNEVSKIIKSGNVKVNYSPIYETSDNIKEGDMISIRGLGRYEIIGISGHTKSGRLKIEIKKYI